MPYISWNLVATILVALIIFSVLRAGVVIAWRHLEVNKRFRAIEREYDKEMGATAKSHK